MKNTLYILIIIMIFSCDQLDDRLIIDNQTKSSIFYIYSTYSMINHTEYSNKDSYLNSYIQPLRKFHENCGLNSWEYIIEHSYNKKLNLYFFELDSLKKYNDMDTLVKSKKWFKNLSLSKSELDRLNWTVKIE